MLSDVIYIVSRPDFDELVEKSGMTKENFIKYTLLKFRIKELGIDYKFLNKERTILELKYND